MIQSLNEAMTQRWRWILLGALLIAALLPGCESDSVPTPPAQFGVDQVEAAYAQRRSGLMVEVTGHVEQLLPDDTEGTPHQRFILGLSNGRTLLVAHNLVLAERVPVLTGDRVAVRGQYEWNPEGGVLHWTHEDPEGDRPGGWIILNGKRYQ